MLSLSFAEIEKFASCRGVNKKAVENFLYTVGLTSSRDSALLNLYYDAVSCDWNIPTVKAIEAGINLAYSEDIERELATTSSIDTVSKGLSSKPQNCIACG
jgi:hypothetical protein